MTYIPQTNETGAGVRRQLAEFEDGFIARGLVISSTDNNAINGAGSGHSVNVQGTVSASGAAITLGLDAASHTQERVLIGRDGYVASAGYANAVNINAGDSVVENEGEIWGAGFGIRMDADSDDTSSSLINSGTIRGNVAAVSRAGSEDFLFINTGRVLSANASWTAFNGFSSGDDTIINSGRMLGHVLLDTGDDSYDGRKGSLDGEVDGGEGNDRILSGTADDRVTGGLGKDMLAGGKGRDTFVFALGENSGGARNLDIIKDFKSADDTFEISYFENTLAMPEGRLSAKQFVANIVGKAGDADDHVIYETDTGNVYFDVDGKGGEKAMLIARVGKELDIDHRDFVILDPVLPDRLEDSGLF